MPVTEASQQNRQARLGRDLVDTKLWHAVDRKLRKLDIKGTVEFLETRLAREKVNRFKKLVGKAFSNSPRSALAEINKFIRSCEESFDLKAVYLEMNGFDVNYDRWYFDSFGYARYGSDPDDLEWLSDWQSGDWPQVSLNGLAAVQKDFEWYDTNEMYTDERFDKAKELAVLLVMTRFVSLIQSALQSGNLAKQIPLLATAHEFDIVGRFEP